MVRHVGPGEKRGSGQKIGRVSGESSAREQAGDTDRLEQANSRLYTHHRTEPRCPARATSRTFRPRR